MISRTARPSLDQAGALLLAAPEAAQTDPLLSTTGAVRDCRLGSGSSSSELLAGAKPASRLRDRRDIIDEWVDVRLTNLSQKSRCVAGLETARSRQVGGAGAVACTGHLRDAGGLLHECGRPRLASQCDGVAIADEQLVKTRFVDRDTGFRLFESKSADLEQIRHETLPDFDDYDVVLIADFGTAASMLPSSNARIAGRQRAFVTAMAQANSSLRKLPTKDSCRSLPSSAWATP